MTLEADANQYLGGELSVPFRSPETLDPCRGARIPPGTKCARPNGAAMKDHGDGEPSRPGTRASLAAQPHIAVVRPHRLASNCNRATER